MKPAGAGTCVSLAALLVLGILLLSPAAGAAPLPLQYSACASPACVARWSALESAMAASYGEAERDGAATITQADAAHRYALSQESLQLERWAASGQGEHVLIFARRDAGGALHIDSVVFAGRGALDWKAVPAPRAALVLQAAGAPEARFWRLLCALPEEPAMIKKRQTLTGLVAAVRASRQILVLAGGAATGDLGRLAFVPDAIRISIQGQSQPGAAAAESAAYADSAPPVGSVNQYGTVISSEPGAVVTLVKSADGKSSLRFDIDPRQFGPATAADPASAAPDPDPSDQ